MNRTAFNISSGGNTAGLLSAQPKRTAKLHTAPNKKDISNMDLANAISKIQPIQKLYLKETGAAAVSKEAAQRGVRSFPFPSHPL